MTLHSLAAALRAGGGLLAAATVDPPAAATDELGRAAAAGDDGYGLTIEAIHEGQLLHAGGGRVLRRDDPDLALLAGDHLYAFGLGRLAELGDLHSVAVLATVIAECARAQAEDEPDRAAGAWARGGAAIARRDQAHGRLDQAPADDD